MFNQGTITVDLDGGGGLLICYPDGSIVAALNKPDAEVKIKRYLQRNLDQVTKVLGHPEMGTCTVQWMNGSNFILSAKH